MIMLYTSLERFEEALTAIKDNPIICTCGKKMKPESWNFSNKEDAKFGKFLRVTCECGKFIKASLTNSNIESYGFSRENAL